MPQVDIRNIVATFPRLLNLSAALSPALRSSMSVWMDAGMLVLVMPVFDFLCIASENGNPSDPLTIAMRPTVHAAWFAMISASQKPMISISALQIIRAIGIISANSAKTDPRGDLSRRPAFAARLPSFLVSHLNTASLPATRSPGFWTSGIPVH